MQRSKYFYVFLSFSLTWVTKSNGKADNMENRLNKKNYQRLGKGEKTYFQRLGKNRVFIHSLRFPRDQLFLNQNKYFFVNRSNLDVTVTYQSIFLDVWPWCTTWIFARIFPWIFARIFPGLSPGFLPDFRRIFVRYSPDFCQIIGLLPDFCRIYVLDLKSKQ